MPDGGDGHDEEHGRALASNLAIMHGSSYTGDGGATLKTLADAYEDSFMPELSFAMDRGEATGPPPEKGGAAAVQVSEESGNPPEEFG